MRERVTGWMGQIGKSRSQGALGWFEVGRGWFKSEFRRPNPRHANRAEAHQIKPRLDFGLRPSFQS
jgi:hypothetical protein